MKRKLVYVAICLAIVTVGLVAALYPKYRAGQNTATYTDEAVELRQHGYCQGSDPNMPNTDDYAVIDNWCAQTYWQQYVDSGKQSAQ